ncbi:DUF481 domain-containing protein [Salinisphaera sp.]|uniref:DUF481 domain-containing protein n=1 Tax=Salinisphaera sp. TaxID=1914330 RepID=UPI002D79FC33|nr:DUF481 domain-containing protein [Salinisphaera sp.]HET7314986.1 DUF481 domain-containing protein [Salinisphaera sp.]
MQGVRWLGGVSALWVALGGGWGVASADTVYLADGSRLEGLVETLSADTLELQTGFAGEIAIQRDLVVGVTTDQSATVALADGRTVEAKLDYAPETGRQSYTVGGASYSVAATATGALGPIRQIAPQAIAVNQEKAKQAEQFVLPEASLAAPKDGDYWSGEFQLGINGNSGNTDNRSILASAAALRDTGPTRLSLSASVDREQEDGDQTAEEYQGEARYENDITSRTFWYVQEKLERDQFQNLDLRSRTTFGPGYFLVRQDQLIFKVRAGLGYQYEDYTDGESSQGEATAELGWDYAQIIDNWLKLTHELTVYPEITNSPVDNYTLDSVLAAQVPLASSTVWGVKLSLENEYNSNPQPGVESTDTTYAIGVTRSF